MNETTLTTRETSPQNTGLSIFDSGIFDQMAAIAGKLAGSSLIPQSLRAEKDGRDWKALPAEQVAANCFRIVEQAQRWGMSPFAVVDCASVVHGKLMWEGKLIAAALEATMGIRLSYSYDGKGESRSVTVLGKFPDEEGARSISGTVAEWKTDQWKATAYDQRLAYRGAREWARRHAPGVILGVYSPDEAEDMRDVTPRQRVEVRSEPINPGAKPAGAIETTPPKGKQKKERHSRECSYKDITEKAGKRPFWVVAFDIGQKVVELITFSSSLAESLSALEPGAPVKIVFTVGAKGDFQLEDFEVIEGKEEGGLI